MIAFLLDIAYVFVLAVASPWLLFKAARTGKYRAGLVEKCCGNVPERESDRPCVWFHAVSVGEVLLLRRVVAALVETRPDVEIVISATTNTGMEVARQHFREYRLIYFPLDFSWAVSKAIARIRPDVVALAELELWPNFIAAARRFGTQIAVINGRMSPRSRRGYGRIRLLSRWMLGQIDAFAVQTQEFAERFREIGAPPHRITVTGSVKYDGISTDRNNPYTAELRALFDLRPGEIIWVAGSTSQPEEEIVLDAYERLRERYANLRLMVVPRHKERFDEVARLIVDSGHPLLRRSQLSSNQETAISDRPLSRVQQSAVSNQQSDRGRAPSPVILIDTLGELCAVWGLADIAFVGGSFAPRGGQNMIEPAGFGAAVTFGPGVWNFQDTVDRLLACGGAVQVPSPGQLEHTIDSLIRDRERRSQLGEAAQRFVQSQYGATSRTVDILCRFLPAACPQAQSSEVAGGEHSELAA